MPSIFYSLINETNKKKNISWKENTRAKRNWKKKNYQCRMIKSSPLSLEIEGTVYKIAP